MICAACVQPHNCTAAKGVASDVLLLLPLVLLPLPILLLLLLLPYLSESHTFFPAEELALHLLDSNLATHTYTQQHRRIR
jgi:hypothetical protein